MKLTFALVLVLFSIARSASPATIDGLWQIEWRCNKEAVKLNPERCLDRSDVFLLDLWSNGQHLCGYYMATAQLGNKVDESEETPSIKGRKYGTDAIVVFVNGDGVKGKASIKVLGNTLRWKIISQDKGSSLLPSEAVLQRQSGDSPWKRHDKCSE